MFRRRRGFEDTLVTGSFDKIGRSELKERLEKLGARVTGSVSKNTDIVLVGEEPGSKLDDAKRLAVTTWSEEDVMKAIDVD